MLDRVKEILCGGEGSEAFDGDVMNAVRLSCYQWTFMFEQDLQKNEN
jgi:hypothetical protein